MPDRRTFLFSAVVGSSLPLIAGMQNTLTTPGRFVSDIDYVESKQFATACSSVTTTTDADPSNLIDNVAQEIFGDDVSWLFGLTRDSNRFIAEQLGAEHGFTQCVSGIHQFRSNTVSHELRGDPEVTSIVLEDLVKGGARWPARLAQSIFRFVDMPAHQNTSRLTANAVSTHQYDGQLSSWLLMRG